MTSLHLVREWQYAAGIQARRAVLGVTQEDVAARLRAEGIPLTGGQVSRIETGSRGLRVSELHAFAAVLGTTVDVLALGANQALKASPTGPDPGLTALFDFERRHPRAGGRKADAVRLAFGLTLGRYQQLLHKHARTPEALRHDPQLTHQITDRATASTGARRRLTGSRHA